MKKQNKYYKYELMDKLRVSRGTIQNLNNNIKSLKIELDFSDNDYYSPDPVSRTLVPNDNIFFAFDCTNDSCTKGFYDLSDIIYSTIRNKKEVVEGEYFCDGSLDELNLNFKCSSKVSYRISIDYDNQNI